MTKNSFSLNNNINYIVTEMLLSDNYLSKKAQTSDMMSGITSSIGDYFGSKIDSNDRVGSFLNMIAPGAIAMIFKSLGFTKLGLLFVIAADVFGINIKGVFETIWQKLKELLSGGQKISPEQTEAVVQEAVSQHTKPSTKEDVEKVQKMLDSNQTRDASKIFRDVRLVKIAILQMEKEGFEKIAQRSRWSRPQNSSNFFSLFSNRKTETTGTLTRVLSWIIQVAVVSSGLMIGGDLIKSKLNMPNSLDHTMKDGKPTNVPEATQPQGHVSTQKKFKLNSGANDPPKNVGQDIWEEGVSNDRSSIETMLVNFAKQIYQGLNGLDNIIRVAPGFQAVADRIENFNHGSSGSASVFIPPYFKTKKQIVDFFIDDIAERAS